MSRIYSPDGEFVGYNDPSEQKTNWNKVHISQDIIDSDSDSYKDIPIIHNNECIGICKRKNGSFIECILFDKMVIPIIYNEDKKVSAIII